MGRYPSDDSRENRRANQVRGTPDRQTGCSSQKSICEWLSQVQFRKAVFGGVQESDVWKKIAELNTMYENALAAERVRYDTLLEERTEVMALEMVRQMVSGNAEQIEQEKAGDVKDE